MTLVPRRIPIPKECNKYDSKRKILQYLIMDGRCCINIYDGVLNIYGPLLLEVIISSSVIFSRTGIIYLANDRSR